MKNAEQSARTFVEDLRDSPRFDAPLYVRNATGRFVERRGSLGISTLAFETNEIPVLGQLVEVKIALLGLGQEVQTRARVISVVPRHDRAGVIARFENIPFDTERMIARWLDLLSCAHQLALAG